MTRSYVPDIRLLYSNFGENSLPFKELVNFSIIPFILDISIFPKALLSQDGFIKLTFKSKELGSMSTTLFLSTHSFWSVMVTPYSPAESSSNTGPILPVFQTY